MDERRRKREGEGREGWNNSKWRENTAVIIIADNKNIESICQSQTRMEAAVSSNQREINVS